MTKIFPNSDRSQPLSLLGWCLLILAPRGERRRCQRSTATPAPGDGRDGSTAAWIARMKRLCSGGVSRLERPPQVTSTPGNKDIITPPMDVTRLDVDAT